MDLSCKPPGDGKKFGALATNALKKPSLIPLPTKSPLPKSRSAQMDAIAPNVKSDTAEIASEGGSLHPRRITVSFGQGDAQSATYSEPHRLHRSETFSVSKQTLRSKQWQSGVSNVYSRRRDLSVGPAPNYENSASGSFGAVDPTFSQPYRHSPGNRQPSSYNNNHLKMPSATPRRQTSPARNSVPTEGGSLKLPLTPEATTHYYKELLTPYELREVFDFPEIYFAGAAGVEKIGSRHRRTGADGVSSSGELKDQDAGLFNGGYDDARGDYYLTNRDHIAYRYEVISLLGKGSFGQVAKCYDHKKRSHVALKIIRNKKRFEKQGMVEVKVLDRLRREDVDNSNHVIHMMDYFYFRSHLCITFELLGVNLYEWLRAGGFRGVHLGVIKRFAVQIIQCMNLLYKHHIVHCDLKPENVLLSDTNFLQPCRCDIAPYSGDPAYARTAKFLPPDFDPASQLYQIKVIDFGSSCLEDEKVYTYVQSRFYRSPEVIIGISYGTAIDMWSLGCILAEMFTGYPLFAGENEQEQLSCIMEILGPPPSSFVDRGTRRKLFFDSQGSPRNFPNSKGKRRRPGSKSLASVLRSPDPLFVDFVGRCLAWEPERRMNPNEALEHDWMKDFISYLSERNIERPEREAFRQHLSGSFDSRRWSTSVGVVEVIPSSSAIVNKQAPGRLPVLGQTNGILLASGRSGTTGNHRAQSQNRAMTRGRNKSMSGSRGSLQPMQQPGPTAVGTANALPHVASHVASPKARPVSHYGQPSVGAAQLPANGYPRTHPPVRSAVRRDVPGPVGASMVSSERKLDGVHMERSLTTVGGVRAGLGKRNYSLSTPSDTIRGGALPAT
ncbi:kinase-like domain-containing protein [Zopfochytrium polystomum]|nr:kinase-like domain-containing protein [Zopfochytrium polystomum]